ncbi:MAG: hypothetical protein R3C68_12690 [Myxococcota bacterium]
MVNSLRSSLVLILLAGFAESALATTYYIAPDGSDSNAGTFEAPWQTPFKARDVLDAGDTVYFRQGTYKITEFVYINGNDGTANAPIIWASAPGEEATIEYDRLTDQGEQTGWVFFVSRAHYHFERLRVSQSARSRTALATVPKDITAFTIWSPGVIVRDCELFSLSGQGVFGSTGATNLLIERNHIHHIDGVDRLKLAAPHGVYVNGKIVNNA